jgi:Ala-tRNA(Pro) deacylase
MADASSTFPQHSPSVFSRLCQLLDSHAVPYRVLRHAPVFTSQQAAQIRGTSLASGAKALVCKADDQFVMIVLPADRKLASKRLRQTAGVRSLRFATADEVTQLTGLMPGAIPPFGSLFGLATWCDQALADQPHINFNAGDHAISLSMAFADYAAVEQPRMGHYAEPAEPQP